MIEPLSDMPAGTVGFRASGEVTRTEYQSVLSPWMEAAIEFGEPIKMLFQMGPDFDHFTAGAFAADAKMGVKGMRHLHIWQKAAVVSDHSWVTHTIELLGWMAPGEVRLFANADIEAAKAWLAEP